MNQREPCEWDGLEYQEAMATFRHYSGMRFIVLTLYATATAWLLHLVLVKLQPGGFVDFILIAMGLIISWVMYDIEVRLARYLVDISRAVDVLAQHRGIAAHINQLHDANSGSVSRRFRLMIGGMGAVWLLVALYKFGPLVFCGS